MNDTQLLTAADINSRFYKEGFVSVPERIDTLLSMNANKQIMEQRIGIGLASWVSNNSDLVADHNKFFSQLPESIYTKLSDIYIDTTLQRYVYFDMIVKILQKYEGIKVQAIKVYRDESGRIICWDGQHTLIMLYLVITRVLKLNPSEVNIPIVVSSGTQRADMRRASMNENGEGKNIFDEFDYYEQHVFGVLRDGIEIPSWQATALKHQYLEACNLFLANQRMSNTHLPGALTRANELMNPNYHPDITKYFAEWCFLLNDSNRPFGGIEVDLMYKFFNRCEHEGINVDTNYIMRVAKACKGVTGNDFNGSQFWALAESSLERHLKEVAGPFEWYIKIDGDVNRNALKRTDARMLDYLCQVFELHDIEVPSHNKEWRVLPNEAF